jgi:DNA-directed RNA polymerase III subunit RPC2
MEIDDMLGPADEEAIHRAREKAAQPIPTMDDKWKLLPAFLKARGLVKQHIDSFNYFVNTEIEQIVKAKSNVRITSDSDAEWYVQYTAVRVGEPQFEEGMSTFSITPQVCRVRDMTYSSMITADVEYWVGEIRKVENAPIGKLPIMLRSDRCRLYGKSATEMEDMGECPYDPGGYFIIRGTEKVLMMQEQLSNNRIIAELDAKKQVQAVCTSSTADNKSRTVVCAKDPKFTDGLFLKHSFFSELIPVVIALKAMGIQSDQEIVQWVGTEQRHLAGMVISLQVAHRNNVLTQNDALRYVGLRGKMKKPPTSDKFDPAWISDVKEVLERQVLSHIPAPNGNFAPKSRYLCLMIRRCLDARHDRTLLDDRDYYGNKRIEGAGQLISLLFEDLFKSFNADIKRQVRSPCSEYTSPVNSAAQSSSRSALRASLSSHSSIR